MGKIKLCYLLLFIVLAATTQAQDSDSSVITNLEELAREGRLPAYEDLRLPRVEGRDPVRAYMDALPFARNDRATTNVVFAEAARDSLYSELEIDDLIQLALENNFDLANSGRRVLISESTTRAEQAFFVPFIDLVGEARATHLRDEDAPSRSRIGKNTIAETNGYALDGGVEATQNLPTGGSILLDASEGKTSTRTSDGDGVFRNREFDANAEVRLIQPLLRGSGLLTGDGTDIGTANLRRARLQELDQSLIHHLDQRDVILDVIREYFRILQIRQQLLVSRDAIRERYRFLDETRIKYDVGRVAESEILRAEIQFLQEVETAITRQQQLDDARDRLLILLGLPLNTPITIVDITARLASQGRIDIPEASEAALLARNHRRELMRADLATELGEINLQVARNSELPELGFDAGVGTFDADDSFQGANEFDNETADAGLTLRIPLQNIARREAKRQTVLRLEQLQTDRLALERLLTQQVLSAHRAVLTTEARLTVLQKRVEQARRNLELINESFDVGFATITEVRLAQDDLFNTEAAYSNAILNYQINLAELYVAMGLPLI